MAFEKLSACLGFLGLMDNETPGLGTNMLSMERSDNLESVTKVSPEAQSKPGMVKMSPANTCIHFFTSVLKWPHSQNIYNDIYKSRRSLLCLDGSSVLMHSRYAKMGTKNRAAETTVRITLPQSLQECFEA